MLVFGAARLRHVLGLCRYTTLSITFSPSLHDFCFMFYFLFLFLEMGNPMDALKQYGTDLTELARAGKLDPVIGREEEIRRALQM